MKLLSDAELLVAVGLVLLVVGCGLVWGPRAAGLALLVLGASLGLVGLAGVVLEARSGRPDGRA